MIEGSLDIALMVIMGYFFLRGIFRGVVKEVVAVLGLFVAFWVASVYWPLGEEHLKAIFDVPGQRGITSFIVIFIVVYFLVNIISIFVDKIVKLTLSPVISALLGSVVGLVKGILLCGILLAGTQVFLKPTDKFFTNSSLWPFIQPVSSQARAWLPENLRAAMNNLNKLPPLNASGGGVPALVPTAALNAVDWKTIQNLLANRPEVITPAWRDKLRNISSPEALSKEDIRRFIEDHRSLFTNGQPAQAPASPTGAAAPSWPQPATE